MIYRVVIGLIPVVLIALFFSGALSMGSAAPATETGASASQGDEKTSDGRAANGLPEAAVTPGQVSEVFRGVDASLEEEIRRRAPEERRREARLRRERLGTWAPEGGGWGR